MDRMVELESGASALYELREAVLDEVQDPIARTHALRACDTLHEALELAEDFERSKAYRRSVFIEMGRAVRWFDQKTAANAA